MLQKNVELYLESLRIANLSPNTIKAYNQALEALMQFLGAQTDARDIDVNVLRAHIQLLAAKGLSANSRNHALRVFKAFGKFLVDEGILPDNVFGAIPPAKMPQRLLPVPSVATVGTLLDGEIPTAWPARDRAELELLYGTGVRVQEAAGITLPDLHGDGTILIHGKGGKERLVPVGKCLNLALQAYLPIREKVLRKRKQKSQALFFSIGPRTRNQMPQPLDVRSVRRTLRDVCKAKGLKPMHPHALRHACATHMLDNGAPLVVIQQLLGHAKLSTTALYAFVSITLMQKSYNQAHPSAA
jgi:site-specific recombinase XerD